MGKLWVCVVLSSGHLDVCDIALGPEEALTRVYFQLLCCNQMTTRILGMYLFYYSISGNEIDEQKILKTSPYFILIKKGIIKPL